MTISDLNGIILGINDKLAAILEKNKEELIGTSGYDYIEIISFFFIFSSNSIKIRLKSSIIVKHFTKFQPEPSLFVFIFFYLIN